MDPITRQKKCWATTYIINNCLQFFNRVGAGKKQEEQSNEHQKKFAQTKNKMPTLTEQDQTDQISLGIHGN